VVGGLLALSAAAVALGLWLNRRQYPPVTSREALHALQLLNTACNTRDGKRLADAERRLADLDRQGKLSPGEKVGFEAIVGLAKAGRWAEAEAAAFRMAQDQVGVGHPAAGDPTTKPAPAAKGKSPR
jgi:hypothetical protein